MPDTITNLLSTNFPLHEKPARTPHLLPSFPVRAPCRAVCLVHFARRVRHGRRDGYRLAQGFSPSKYRCKEGITTVINAIGELPHEALYASNANLSFEKDGMTPELFASVFRVFAGKGSHMMQPNCHSIGELLDAQAHPERHHDIIVRVCGFSARFVSLSKRWQDEVIARHRLR